MKDVYYFGNVPAFQKVRPKVLIGEIGTGSNIHLFLLERGNFFKPMIS